MQYLKSNPLFLREFKNKSNVDSEVVNIKIGKECKKIRLIKYEIGKETYILGTTHTKLSVEHLKELYRKRWKI